MQKITIDPKVLHQITKLPTKDFLELLSAVCSSCPKRPQQDSNYQLMASILLGYATQLFEQSGCKINMTIDNDQWKDKRIQYCSKGYQHECNCL